MNELDRVRGWLIEVFNAEPVRMFPSLADAQREITKRNKYLADLILSNPSIQVLADDQSLPNVTFNYTGSGTVGEVIHHMGKAGFKKVVEK